MLYQIIPTIIFFVAVFLIIVLILKKLSKINQTNDILAEDVQKNNTGWINDIYSYQTTVSKVKQFFIFWLKKIWRLALEAKEIAPSGSSVLKIKQFFSTKNKFTNLQLSKTSPINLKNTSSEKSETEILESIKNDPKNLINYDNLGKYYIDNHNYEEAKQTYEFLTSHSSGNPDFWAKLGFCSFKILDYEKSVSSYKKSLDLDSAQPNRYYNLAVSYKALGEIQNSVNALNKALEMDYNNFKYLEFKERLEKLMNV